MSRKFLALLIALTMALLTACGGGMSLPKMPVDQAKGLNADMTTGYESVNGSWTAAQEHAGNIGASDGVDITNVNVEGFQTMMTECVNAAPEAMKVEGNEATKDGAVDAKETKAFAMRGPDTIKGCSTDKYDALSSEADDQTKGFYKAKFDTVNDFRTNIILVQENGKALIEGAPAQIEAIAKTRAEAEAALEATKANPIANDEQKAKAQADYDLVISELDSAQAVGDKIMSDFANLIPDATALGAKVVNDIQNFGQAPAVEGGES